MESTYRCIQHKIIPIVLWPIKVNNIYPSQIEIIPTEKHFKPVNVKTGCGWINYRWANVHLIVFVEVSEISDTGSKHLKPFKYKAFKEFTR